MQQFPARVKVVRATTVRVLCLSVRVCVCLGVWGGGACHRPLPHMPLSSSHSRICPASSGWQNSWYCYCETDAINRGKFHSRIFIHSNYNYNSNSSSTVVPTISYLLLPVAKHFPKLDQRQLTIIEARRGKLTRLGSSWVSSATVATDAQHTHTYTTHIANTQHERKKLVATADGKTKCETKLKNYGSKYRACQLKLRHVNFKLASMPQGIHNTENKKKKASKKHNQENQRARKMDKIRKYMKGKWGKVDDSDRIDSSLI